MNQASETPRPRESQNYWGYGAAYASLLAIGIALAMRMDQIAIAILPWLGLAAAALGTHGLRNELGSSHIEPLPRFSLRAGFACMLAVSVIFAVGRTYGSAVSFTLAHLVWLAVLMTYCQVRHLPVAGALTGLWLATGFSMGAYQDPLPFVGVMGAYLALVGGTAEAFARGHFAVAGGMGLLLVLSCGIAYTFFNGFVTPRP
jgi:hypothetical protein